MIKRNLGLFLLFQFLFFSAGLDAQKRYWVFFSNKDGVQFDPYKYFDAAAIQKRQLKQIPLAEYSDLPLREDFKNDIKKITGDIGTESRWFNAVAIKADKNTLARISELPFVTGVQEINMVAYKTEKDFNPEVDFDNDKLRESQLDAMGKDYFEDFDLDGTGVRIAVFDGGFPGVDTSPMFQHLRESGRIIATWDFVKKTEFVYDYSSHGTMVLTCIAGKLDDKKFGLAPGAEFLLARTEVTREVFSEEENWLAAVEWADKNGADIISSSLGYTFNRYFPKDMDGKSTLVTRSANLAASKGMLVINAAGNDGDKKWEVIGAPADADSILSIGGVSPENGYHIKFSSFGPTYDGRMKPNLVAFGQVTTSNQKKVKQSYGTSFATPLVSGFAACVMQYHPEWSNMEVFDEMQKSGHLYPYFDYAHGYGVPQASYFTLGKPVNPPTFEFSEDEDNLIIQAISDEDESYYSPEEDSAEMAEMENYAAENQGEFADSVNYWYDESDTLDTDTQDYYEEVEDTASQWTNGDEYVNDDIQEFADQVEPDAEDTTDIFTEYDELALADSVQYPDEEAWYNSEIGIDGPVAEGYYELDKDFLYFKIVREEETKITRYGIVNMRPSDEFKLSWGELEYGDKITVYYRGYIYTYEYN
jgi:serine protease AprX